jgi:hypothetical protein
VGNGRALIRRLQGQAGNQAVQRLVQREYTPTVAEEFDFGLITKMWNKTEQEVPGVKAQVVKWCKNHSQFQSLVNNVTWDEFVALKKKYTSGELVPVKIAAIRLQMQKEMKAELEAIAKAQAEARKKQIENFRKTGQPGAGLTYVEAYNQQIISGITHALTFRTEEEKKQKTGHPTGPFTRNFSLGVGGAPALWELHVHYKDSKDQQVMKAHVKLISQRYSHDHVRDLAATHVLVTATTAKIQAGVDNTLTDL